MLQADRQPLATRMQFDNRVPDKAKLVQDILEANRITARQGRPAFLDSLDALARLHDHRGIKPTISPELVVHWREPSKVIGLANSDKAGRLLTTFGQGLDAEKQQLFGQSFGDVSVTSNAGRILHQYLGRGPLDIQIHWQRTTRHGLEEAGTQDPENAFCALGIRLRHGRA